MPVLRLAIDGTGAKPGADQFVAQGERVKVVAQSVDRAINRMFSFLLVGGGIYQVFETLKRFDYTMSQIAGVTRGTADEVNRFRDAARKLGSETMFSSNEAAEAMLTLAKAGFEANEAISTTPQILALAQGHALDLATAAETVAVTMKQFHLSSADAETIVDSLGETAAATATDVRELSQAMKFIGTQASTMGISLDETNAALGTLAQGGIRGAMAGTNLRGVIKSLIDPSREGRKEIEALGLTMEQVDPRTNDLVDVFQRLNDAGLSAGSAINIFNQRNATAALTLAQNVETYDALLDRLHETTGVTKQLSDRMADSLQGSWERFKNALEAVTLSAGESGLVGALRDALDFMRGFFLALSDMEPTLEGVAQAGKEVGEVFEALAFGAIAGGAVYFAQVLNAQLVPALRAVGTAVKAITAAAMANPYLILVSAVAAAAAALYYFKDSMIEVGGTSARLQDWILGAWDVLVEGTVAAWEGLTSVVSAAWDSWIANTAAGWEEVKSYWSEAMSSISGWLNSWGLVDFFKSSWESIKTYTKDFANFLVSVVVGAIDTMGDLMDRFTDALTAMFLLDFSSWEGFKSSVVAFGVKMAEAADITSVATDMAANFWNAYQTDWVDLGGKAIDSTVSFMKEEFLSAAGDIADAIGGSYDTVAFAMGLAFDKVAEKARARFQASLDPADFVGPEFLPTFNTLDDTEGTETQINAVERWRDQLQGLVDDLRLEAETIGFTANEVEQLTLMRRAEQIMKEAGVAVDQEYLDQLREEIKVVQQLRAGQYFKDLVKHYQDEREFMMLSNDERERAIVLRDAERAAIEAGLSSYADDLDRINREITLNQKLSKMKDLAEDVGRAFESSLTDALTRARSLEEAFNDLGAAIFRAVVQQTVAAPAASALSSILGGIMGSFVGGAATPAAKGAAFVPQSVTPMASGGALYSPSITPLANGGSALIAEAGPELVLPAARTSDGRLGVEVVGGSDGSRQRPIQVTIVTPDADSFRRSRAQVASELSRALQSVNGRA